MAYIAGAYQIAFGDLTGLLTESGFSWSLSPGLVPVRDDARGRSVLDMIACGMEAVTVRADIISTTAGVGTPSNITRLMSWMYYNTTAGKCYLAGTLLGTAGNANLCKALVLTPANGEVGKDTFTFARAIVSRLEKNFSSTRLLTWSTEWTVMCDTNHVFFTRGAST
jgi:hypothetical protein